MKKLLLLSLLLLPAAAFATGIFDNTSLNLEGFKKVTFNERTADPDDKDRVMKKCLDEISNAATALRTRGFTIYRINTCVIEPADRNGINLVRGAIFFL